MGCFVNLPIQQTLLGTMHSGWINVIIKYHCVRKKMTLTCGWNAYMYMCFGFYFFQIGNHTKNDCPLSIISCSFLSVGCNTKVWFLHFLNQSLFIVLIVIIYYTYCICTYCLVSFGLGDSPLWLVALIWPNPWEKGVGTRYSLLCSLQGDFITPPPQDQTLPFHLKKLVMHHKT